MRFLTFHFNISTFKFFFFFHLLRFSLNGNKALDFPPFLLPGRHVATILSSGWAKKKTFYGKLLKGNMKNVCAVRDATFTSPRPTYFCRMCCAVVNYWESGSSVTAIYADGNTEEVNAASFTRRMYARQRAHRNLRECTSNHRSSWKRGMHEFIRF